MVIAFLAVFSLSVCLQSLNSTRGQDLGPWTPASVSAGEAAEGQFIKQHWIKHCYCIVLHASHPQSADPLTPFVFVKSSCQTCGFSVRLKSGWDPHLNPIAHTWREQCKKSGTVNKLQFSLQRQGSVFLPWCKNTAWDLWLRLANQNSSGEL